MQTATIAGTVFALALVASTAKHLRQESKICAKL